LVGGVRRGRMGTGVFGVVFRASCCGSVLGYLMKGSIHVYRSIGRDEEGQKLRDPW
jgi:hypothetical protein